MAQRSLSPFNVMKTRFPLLGIDEIDAHFRRHGKAWNGKCSNFRLLFVNVARAMSSCLERHSSRSDTFIYSLIPRALLSGMLSPENELDCTLHERKKYARITTQMEEKRITTQMKSTRSPIRWVLHRIQPLCGCRWSGANAAVHVIKAPTRTN